jgi:hypothetical protein
MVFILSLHILLEEIVKNEGAIRDELCANILRRVQVAMEHSGLHEHLSRLRAEMREVRQRSYVRFEKLRSLKRSEMDKVTAEYDCLVLPRLLYPNVTTTPSTYIRRSGSVSARL